MNILDRILAKRGIKDITELDKEEQKTFQEWKTVLSKDELTTEDIKIFCQSQINVIEGKWADLNTDQTRKAELIPYHTTYKLLLAAINSPKQARESLEAQLQQLIQ